MRLIVAALSAVVLTVAPPLQAQATRSGEVIMRRAAAAYSALNSFKAEFRQRIEDDFVDHDDARGTLYQRGRNRFAMRFSEPKGSAIVMDGSQVWIYEPKDLPGQVVKHPMPSDPTYGYNIIGWLLDNPTEKYRASWLREEQIERRPVDVILLEPITANPPFRRATLWLDRDDLLPRKIETDERFQTRVVTLSRIEIDAQIPDEVFVFEPPRGARVLEQ